MALIMLICTVCEAADAAFDWMNIALELITYLSAA